MSILKIKIDISKDSGETDQEHSDFASMVEDQLINNNIRISDVIKEYSANLDEWSITTTLQQDIPDG